MNTACSWSKLQGKCLDQECEQTQRPCGIVNEFETEVIDLEECRLMDSALKIILRDRDWLVNTMRAKGYPNANASFDLVSDQDKIRIALRTGPIGFDNPRAFKSPSLSSFHWPYMFLYGKSYLEAITQAKREVQVMPEAESQACDPWFDPKQLEILADEQSFKKDEG